MSNQLNQLKKYIKIVENLLEGGAEVVSKRQKVGFIGIKLKINNGTQSTKEFAYIDYSLNSISFERFYTYKDDKGQNQSLTAGSGYIAHLSITQNKLIGDFFRANFDL